MGQIGGLDGSFWAILGFEKQPQPNICRVGVALAAVAAELCSCGSRALQLRRLCFGAVAPLGPAITIIWWTLFSQIGKSQHHPPMNGRSNNPAKTNHAMGERCHFVT